MKPWYINKNERWKVAKLWYTVEFWKHRTVYKEHKSTRDYQDYRKQDYRHLYKAPPK